MGSQAPPIASFVFEKANFWEMNITIERFVNLLIVTSTEARFIEYCRFNRIGMHKWDEGILEINCRWQISRGDVRRDPFSVTLNRLQAGGHWCTIFGACCTILRCTKQVVPCCRSLMAKNGFIPSSVSRSRICPLSSITRMIYRPTLENHFLLLCD